MNVNMMYNRTIKDYEVIDENNIKVNYVSGYSMLVNDSREQIDEEIKKQVKHLITKEPTLTHAFNYKGLASMWTISGMISIISCIADSKITLFCILVWLNAFMQTLISGLYCWQIGNNVYPYYPSLLKTKKEIKKYKLFLENEDEINEYLFRIGESNLEQNVFDGSLNGVQKLSLKQMKKIVEDAKK